MIDDNLPGLLEITKYNSSIKSICHYENNDMLQ